MGSIVATFHDVLVTLAFLAFFRYEMIAERHRGDADDGRLFDERHDRHLRPRAREHPVAAARPARIGHQHEPEPDADADDHHLGHGLRCGAGAVPLRRRSAATDLRSPCWRAPWQRTYSGWFIAPSLAIMLSRKPPTRAVRAAAVEATASHSRRASRNRSEKRAHT